MHAEDNSSGDPKSRRYDSIATSAAVVAFVVLSVLAVAIFFWQLAQVILMAFGAVLVAIFFRAVAEGIAHVTGLSYMWSLALGLVLMLLVSATGLYFSGEPVANQMASLADEIPRSWEKLSERLQSFSWGERLLNTIPQSTEEIPLSGKEVTAYAAGFLSSLTGGIATFFLIVFLALYLSISPSTYCDGAVRLFPVAKRPRIRDVMHKIHEALRWWLLGTMVSMVLVGTCTTIGLWLLGIPLPVALGVIAALFTFIPNFGPVLSALPALLLAFVESPMSAVYVGVLYSAVQTVESYLITPLIQQRTVSLPPALTILAQVGLGVLLGLPGVVLAAPLTAAAMVLITQLYIEDVLEKDSSNSKTADPTFGS